MRQQTFEQISVVVQGPVQNYQGRTHHEEGITQRCLESIRTHLPGAKIILSTWPDQDLTGLSYDQLVISQDPGVNLVDSLPQFPKNYDRQLVSTQAGLAQVTTPYAIKLRSDNYLIGNDFVSIQQTFSKYESDQKLFNEKVVINSNLFRRTSHGRTVLMSPSDFFYFGTTEDLKKIWQLPLIAEQPIAEEMITIMKSASITSCTLEAEQFYCQIWLKALNPKTKVMQHRFDYTQKDIIAWERFLASNIIIADPETMGLGLRKISKRKLKRANEFSHIDWLKLYKKYCDHSVTIPKNYHQWLLEIRRAFKLPLSNLSSRFKHR
ncbi:WavE lipopolysaccharide synthesis family protein [Photobacterium damselae]|uniref:WavE lipopolysaccharide synthesis family protein n=1 Tax=Photobacterium damselae TaxID=38293 RepID=UPI0015E7C90E|nr:WavE lipopolysaccharide synthesis family protein [Photobacterium damselae]MCG3816503.1 LPS biosynthesis protein WavE [Photobacterium damselae]